MKIKSAAILFLLFLGVLSYSCTVSPKYKQRPISISYKKYKAIQARRYTRREVAIVPKQFREPSKISLIFSSSSRKVYYVNNNKINRNNNRKIVAQRRKSQNNYSSYREATEIARSIGADRSNFSIYDK